MLDGFDRKKDFRNVEDKGSFSCEGCSGAEGRLNAGANEDLREFDQAVDLLSVPQNSRWIA